MQALRRIRAGSPPGFALITTLSILALLVLIAIGLFSLMTVVTRGSSQADARLQARANARLALQVAIGELQRTMGPDTRVSANAEILEGGGAVNSSYGKVAGVWNAWRPDPTEVGEYGQRKTGEPVNETSGSDQPVIPRGGFYQWLMSTRDMQAAGELDFVRSGSTDEIALLVPRLGKDIPAVEVETVPITDGDGESGHFAWAVLDEGQKAPLNASEWMGEDGSRFRDLDVLNRQPEPAWGNVQDWKMLGEVEEDPSKFVSHETLELIGMKDAEESFHDLTPASSSVLSNVIDGGLKTDLSLLFQDESLPPEYQTRHLYSNRDLPIMDAPPRGRHPYQLPSPDPRWQTLHEYYRLPFDVYNPDDPRISFNATSQSTRRAAASVPQRMVNLRTNPDYHDAVKLAPVISKAQFIFSLTFARGSNLTRAWEAENSASGRNGSRWKAQALMIIDPIITLWNPYDVPIDVNRFRIYLYRMPLAFRFTNDTSRHFQNPNNYTDFTHAIGTGANRNLAHAYPLSILPEVGEQRIELQPGEHRVFSAHDYQSVWSVGKAQTEGRSVEMRPGWNPPGTRGGLAQYVGGLSTENLCKNNRQRASARYRTDRGFFRDATSILVGENDRVSVRVRPTITNTSSGNFRTLGGEPSDFYLRYGAWAEDSQIRAYSEQEHLADFGAIELDYGETINDRSLFPELQSGRELPTFPINRSDISHAFRYGTSNHFNRNGHPHSPSPRGGAMKKPFLMATLHLKDLVGSSYTSKFPAKAWIHNAPANLYASAGFGGDEAGLSSQQYEFSYQPLQGSWEEGAPEITGDRHRGFGGLGPDAESGRTHAPAISLPRGRLTSLAQLRHAPLNQSGKQPLQSQVAANSFAHPMLGAEEIINEPKFYLDHSFLANQTLFDGAFFSTALNTEELSLLFTKNESLIESRLKPASSLPAEEVEALLGSGNGNEAYRKAAAFLMMEGGFNVNSTSVNAWLTFLAGLNQKGMPMLASLETNELEELSNPDGEPHLTRFHLPLEETLGGTLDPLGAQSEHLAFRGYRRLDEDELRELAERIVEQVKRRGPFQSLGEFINRRAEDSDLGRHGCLESAIELAGINDEVSTFDHIPIAGDEEGSESYAFPEAAAGSSLTGTPGYLTQGDLLQTMAPYLSPRSDTFRIRAYGAATDSAGKVIARAWCEAMLQRTPEFFDPGDEPHEFVDANGKLELSATNQEFGRRFKIISFRWLSEPVHVNS